MSPLFSIIIPTFNSQKTIKRCIDSVQFQTFKDFEIIVVDNYSTDDTIQIIRTYDNIKIYQEKNNGIIAHSRNVGIKVSSGKWICFLDSDDWWEKHKLEKVALHTEGNDFIYHPLMLKYGKFNIIGFNRIIGRQCMNSQIVDDILMNGNFAPTSSVCIRKSIVDEVGIISEDINLRGVEDTDYYLTVAKLTSKFFFLNEICGYYWIDNNTSISLKQIEKEEFLFGKHVELLSAHKRQLAEMQLELKKARIYHRVGYFDKSINHYSTYLKSRMSFRVLILMILAFFHISQ